MSREPYHAPPRSLSIGLKYSYYRKATMRTRDQRYDARVTQLAVLPVLEHEMTPPAMRGESLTTMEQTHCCGLEAFEEQEVLRNQRAVARLRPSRHSNREGPSTERHASRRRPPVPTAPEQAMQTSSGSWRAMHGGAQYPRCRAGSHEAPVGTTPFGDAGRSPTSRHVTEALRHRQSARPLPSSWSVGTAAR